MTKVAITECQSRTRILKKSRGRNRGSIQLAGKTFHGKVDKNDRFVPDHRHSFTEALKAMKY